MLIKPLITEKSVSDAANKRYTFVVDRKDNKTAIKTAVEKLFGVKVLKIQTAVYMGKSYRMGKKWVFKNKSDWKKATVTINPDQKIDLFEASVGK